MQLSVLCLLGLVTVALAQLPKISWPMEKPGVCPTVIIPFGTWGQNPVTCSADWQCPGMQKCCNIGFQRFCVDPEPQVVPTPKQGFCPPPSPFGVCGPVCVSDQDCDEDMKCCLGPCGKTCIKSFGGFFGMKKCCSIGFQRFCVDPELQGFCPPPSPFGVCGPVCVSDQDCDEDMKCCLGPCGKTCIKPFGVTKPKCGSCPGLHPCRYCKSDHECPMNMKCCLNGFKTICTEAVGGCCPPFNVLMQNNECKQDAECPKKLKCCYNKCDSKKTCMEPTKTTNPGCCPGPLENCDTCVHDSQCQGNLKCCPNKCNRKTCMETRFGFCPMLQVMECKDECSDDCDCKKPLKCCYSHCERRKTCMKPADSQPRTCPPPKFFIMPCANECSGNQDCPNNLMCCFSGCGMQCL